MQIDPDTAERLSSIQRFLRGKAKPVSAKDNTFVLFLSASDGDRRARVAIGRGASLEEAWQAGLDDLRALMDADGIAGRWIRVDWAEGLRPTNWADFRSMLSMTKRNYFRYGIALDREFRHAFTEQELNANAMLYGGNTIASAVLNEGNFRTYARQRFRHSPPPVDFKDDGEIFLFATRGVFCDEDGVLHALEGPGLDTGRRRIEALNDDHLMSLVTNASAYLSRQVNPDGLFAYGFHPCFDRPINAYNTLRHASTTYSMIEAWEVTRDEELLASIERALRHLTQNLIRDVRLPDGTEAAFLVDVGDEIKLGGCAVAVLALAKHASATGSNAHAPVMERLALGIRHMQDSSTGAFVHVLNFPDLTHKQRFRTIYYEGEAAFGLMRLYELTGDERWLAVVEKAFDHFIASQHWKHHDHWLGYCVNELTRHRPEERYLRFGLQNVAGYLDFVHDRITTFPTLLELMMAARETITRIDANPSLHHLLHDIDVGRFEAALEKRAHYLLNGHFWPEMAMYFRNPDRIAGSFFIRHHAFRVRIDDVEHYLSGLIAYKRYLGERERFHDLVARHAGNSPTLPAAASAEEGESWTADRVAAVTGGRWVRKPPSDWTAAGLATYAPAARAGDMVVVRLGEEKIGILQQVLPRLPSPSALITSDPEIGSPDLPLLVVPDTEQAVLGLGRRARDRMSGKVAAITGSAGKTTMVAMLGKALSAWGDVATTRFNANLPIGVAWNLASIPWDVPHVVLELAVGRMAVSSRMARPHVAIFTNVLPAHLGEKSTVADIARTKSAIFLGVEPGGTAVINRDMLERQIVEDAARRQHLDIVWYGAGAECDFGLLGYDIDSGMVRASIRGREISYRIGAAGTHMALNSLASLAAVSALGHPLEPAIAMLESFSALPGRGEQITLNIAGRELTIIDDAYNANPGSMRAALDRLSAQRSRGRRIAVLGQMAELGPDAAAYHTELASLVSQRTIDRVYVTGELYEGFWDELPQARKGFHAPTLDGLRENLLSQLEDGDTVLFKGSNSTRLHELVGFIKEQASP